MSTAYAKESGSITTQDCTRRLSARRSRSGGHPPGRFLGDSEMTGQHDRRDALGPIQHQEKGENPSAQIELCGVRRRSCCDRELTATFPLTALIEARTGRFTVQPERSIRPPEQTEPSPRPDQLFQKFSDIIFRRQQPIDVPKQADTRNHGEPPFGRDGDQHRSTRKH